MDTITTYHFDADGGRVNVTVSYEPQSQLVIHQYEGQPHNNYARPASWWLEKLGQKDYDKLLAPNRATLDFLRSI
jgi:hypothetical protein